MAYTTAGMIVGVLTLVGFQVPFPVALTQEVERASCALSARDAVDQGLTVETRARSIANLTNCPVAGPTVLSGMWREKILDTMLLGTLSGVSGTLRDERLLTAVLEVASSPGAERRWRVEALKSAATQFNASVVVEIAPPTRLPDGREIGRVLTGLSEYPREVPGSIAVAGDSRARITAMLRQIADSGEPDEVIRTIAARLVKRLPELARMAGGT